jgi:hypothetical protein
VGRVLRQERLHRCHQYLQSWPNVIRLQVCYRVSRMCGCAENGRSDGLSRRCNSREKIRSASLDCAYAWNMGL